MENSEDIVTSGIETMSRYIKALSESARKEENCPSLVLVLYCAISSPTHELSELLEVTLATVVVVAAVGVVDPPPPPSGGCFPFRPEKMSDRKGRGLRISNPVVVISSSMGGFSPARFANHASFSIVFSDATICGKRCRHLSIIALPLSAGVGLITTIATAPTGKAASAAASTSATTTASSLGEFGLGLINPMLVDRLGAFRDAMIRITAIETSINAMFLWNIPLIQYIQRIELIVSLLARRLDVNQTRRVIMISQITKLLQPLSNQQMCKSLPEKTITEHQVNLLRI